MGERLAKTFVAAVASHDPATWVAMFTDDARYSIPDAPEPVRGHEAAVADPAGWLKLVGLDQVRD